MQCLFSTLHPMRQLLYLQCCLLIVFWTKRTWMACQKPLLLWTNQWDQDGRVLCLFSVPHSMHMHHHHQFCFLSNLSSQRNKWLEERNSRVRTMSQRVWLIFNALLNWTAAKSSMRFSVFWTNWTINVVEETKRNCDSKRPNSSSRRDVFVSSALANTAISERPTFESVSNTLFGWWNETSQTNEKQGENDKRERLSSRSVLLNFNISNTAHAPLLLMLFSMKLKCVLFPITLLLLLKKRNTNHPWKDTTGLNLFSMIHTMLEHQHHQCCFLQESNEMKDMKLLIRFTIQTSQVNVSEWSVDF